MSLRRLQHFPQHRLSSVSLYTKVNCNVCLNYPSICSYPFLRLGFVSTSGCARATMCNITTTASSSNNSLSSPFPFSCIRPPSVLVLCYLCDKCVYVCVCVCSGSRAKQKLLPFTPERVDPVRRRWPMTIVRPHHLLRSHPPTPPSSDRRYPRPSSPRRACA